MLEGPASEVECREALVWVDRALAPIASLRRLLGVLAVLAIVAFLIVWPMVALVGAAISFGDIALCYLVIVALTAPFALIGERDKAHRVVEYAGQTAEAPRTPQRV